MLATNEGNGTVGATAVASLAYLEIGVMPGRRLQTLSFETIVIFDLERAHQLAPLMDTIKGINLGQFFSQLLLIALDKAAYSYQLLLFATAFLNSNLFKENIDRFLFGIAYKTAGVYYDDITIVARPVEIEFEASFAQMTRNMFGIDNILRATQCDDIYLHFSNYQTIRQSDNHATTLSIILKQRINKLFSIEDL